MALTGINSEDRLVQRTFAEYLELELWWDSALAWKQETFGPAGTLGRTSERDVVLVYTYMQDMYQEMVQGLMPPSIAELEADNLQIRIAKAAEKKGKKKWFK